MAETSPTGNKYVDAALGARITFCGGVAIVAVTFPPNYEAWLTGEVGEYQLTAWIVSVGAIARGVLTALFALANVKNPFKTVEKVEKG